MDMDHVQADNITLTRHCVQHKYCALKGWFPCCTVLCSKVEDNRNGVQYDDHFRNMAKRCIEMTPIEPEGIQAETSIFATKGAPWMWRSVK